MNPKIKQANEIQHQLNLLYSMLLTPADYRPGVPELAGELGRIVEAFYLLRAHLLTFEEGAK